MSKTKPIGGYAEVRFNGEMLLFRGDMTHNFQTEVKEGVVGRDKRSHGFTVKPVLPFIEGEFTHDGSFSTADYEAISGATITARLADGRVLVLRGAYVAGDIVVNDDDAKVKLKFEGTAGEELKAAA